jgi:hypothetical protein
MQPDGRRFGGFVRFPSESATEPGGVVARFVHPDPLQSDAAADTLSVNGSSE